MDTTSDSSIEKCVCDETESAHESDGSCSESPKDRKTKIFPSLGLNLRRGRSLHLASKKAKKENANAAGGSSGTGLNTAIKKFIQFKCVKKEPKELSEATVATGPSCCKCTCYKPREELAAVSAVEESVVVPKEQFPIVVREEVPEVITEGRESDANPAEVEGNNNVQDVRNNYVEEPPVDNGSNVGIYGTGSLALPPMFMNAQFIDVQNIRSIHEDCDEQARMQRAREIEQGVDPPANFRSRVQLLCSNMEGEGARRLHVVCPPDWTVDSLRALFQTQITVRLRPLDAITGCHTQVDFIHCLVPDLLDITNCSFYWGKMDRYEAERLLDGKPEGTFLLRDSAQEEFLFSVSFRKYGRSLHARIEQWNHKFSFDSHDPNVYTSTTVCGLIEHYKDPSSCMFFEPMLTRPLHRNFTFPLQYLCRATVVNRLTYDNINQLLLPKMLKCYLKEYHYRQKVRVERFDDDVQWLDLRNSLP